MRTERSDVRYRPPLPIDGNLGQFGLIGHEDSALTDCLIDDTLSVPHRVSAQIVAFQ